MKESCRHHQKGDGSWWMHDCQGIPLCRVCDLCEREHMKKYNSWVFDGYDQGFLDEYSGEQLEPDY
jgi:hypothetical protein